MPRPRHLALVVRYEAVPVHRSMGARDGERAALIDGMSVGLRRKDLVGSTTGRRAA